MAEACGDGSSLLEGGDTSPKASLDMSLLQRRDASPLDAEPGDRAGSTHPGRVLPTPPTTSPSATTPALRLLDQRVDWFEVRARVRFRRAALGGLDVVAELRRAAKRAIEVRSGCVGVRLGDLAFGEMRSPRVPLFYRLTNADYTLEIDCNRARLSPTGGAEEGWNVTLRWRAVALAERGFDPGLSREILAQLGQVEAVRVARVDMATTFAGWTIRDRDRKALVVRARAHVKRYYLRTRSIDLTPPVARSPGDDVEQDAPASSARPKRLVRRLEGSIEIKAYGAQRCTGFTVGEGGDIMLRCYDKLAELVGRGEVRRDEETGALHARTRKGEVELAIWKRAGMDRPHETSITRIEFQVRGAALEEFGVRDPNKLRSQLGPIWRYLVGVPGKARGWVRLVIPGSATRKKNAKLDPRWEALQAVEWEGAGSIATRIRRAPRGATYRQAIGAGLSAIAEAGMLPDLYMPQWADKGLDLDDRIQRMHENECADVLSGFTHDAMRELANLTRDSLVAQFGCRGALRWMATKADATRMRFARIEFAKWQASEREWREERRTGLHTFERPEVRARMSAA